MNRKEIIPVIMVTSLLIIYTVLISIESFLTLVNIIFIASPFFIVWMVYSVLHFGKYKGRELNENEEWGYADKEKGSIEII